MTNEKINLRHFVFANKDLCPVIFETPDQIYTSVLNGLMRIADFWWADTRKMLCLTQRRDVIIYGDIVSYVYNQFSEVSLGILCDVPADMRPYLPQINQTLVDSEIKYKFIKRPIHCRILDEISEHIPAYSLLSKQWLVCPQKKELPFDGEELCHEFSAYQQQVQQYVQSLPKLENNLLTPEGCRQLEEFLLQLERVALSFLRQSVEHEYNLQYLLWRTFKEIGAENYYRRYVTDSYNYNINALEQY